jgi:2-keto-4-pentenoate hydratase/2-oxohepta-3-ene-1,7-dioic acid hydratase in catechol pathway
MSAPEPVTRSNFANLYWNIKQQLVHHSVTGCNMNAGDLLGSGTISGTTEDPPTVCARPVGRFSARIVAHSKSVSCGAFVSARR